MQLFSSVASKLLRLPGFSFLLTDTGAAGFYFPVFLPPLWGPADVEIKVPSVENQSSKILSLKPGVGHHTVMHATLTARDLFLAVFSSRSIHLHFSPKPLPSFSCVNCGSGQVH